jgi:hypothetical protein
MFAGKAIGVEQLMEQLMEVPCLLVEKHLADRHFVYELNVTCHPHQMDERCKHCVGQMSICQVSVGQMFQSKDAEPLFGAPLELAPALLLPDKSLRGTNTIAYFVAASVTKEKSFIIATQGVYTIKILRPHINSVS